MAEPQANLRVRISADLADIKAGIGTLRGDIAKFKRDTERSFDFDKATSNFRSALRQTRTAIFAVTAAAAAIAAPIKSAIDRADELSKAAQKVGIGTKALSELAYAAELSDVEFEALKKSLGIFNKQLTGNETLLKRNGIATRDANGQYRETQDIIRDLADLFAKTPDGPQKAALAMKLFGKSGADMIPLLNGGSKAMREAADEAARLGKTISDSAGKRAEAFNDNLTRLKSVVVGVATALANEFLPSLIRASQGLIDGAKSTGTIAAAARTVSTVIKTLIENLDVLAVFMASRLAASAIPVLITAFTAIRAAITAATAAAITLRGALLLLGGPVGLVVAALATALYVLYQRTGEAARAAKMHTEALQQNAAMAKTSEAAALADAQAKRTQAIETLKAAQAAVKQAQVQAQISNAQLGRSRGGSSQGALALQGAANTNEVRASDARNRVSEAQRQLDDWTQRMVDLDMQIAMSAEKAATSTASNTGLVLDSAEKAKKAVKGVVDEAALAVDAIKRETEELDRLFETGAVRIADYFTRKRDLELASIDAAIAQAKEEARTATSSDQQSRALTEIIKLQRDRAAVGPKVARDQAAAEEDLTKKLGELKIKLLELDGQTGRAALLGLEEEFREFFQRLEVEGDETGKALLRNLINRTAAKAQLDQFRNDVSRVMGELRAAETSLSAQGQAGMLGGLEAERQIAAQRDLTLEQLRKMREDQLAYLATLAPGSAEHTAALQGLQELNGNIASVVSSQQELKQKIEDVAVSSLTTFFTDLASGAKSAKDAFKDFVRSFVAGIAQMIARQLALLAVKSAMRAMGFAVMHTGGIAGEGGTRRQVSSLLLGEAPRYHSGGFAGLGQGEVAAVLQRGEEVLTKRDPRHVRNGGLRGGGEPVIRNIVVFSEDELANALAGAAGEKVIVTHARSNRTAINSG